MDLLLEGIINVISQRYQRFTTIPTILNDTNDSQQYRRLTTIWMIHNDTNDSQWYHLKNSDKECKIYQSSSERLTIFIRGFTMKRLDHFWLETIWRILSEFNTKLGKWQFLPHFDEIQVLRVPMWIDQAPFLRSL